jgi:DNA polymerase-3 subunit alpha
MDHPITGVEMLHLHTHSSLLDGVGFSKEYAERISQINQKYYAVTDHGTMAEIPDQIKYAEKYGLSPIFGCELYSNRMQPEVEVRQESADFRKDLSEEDQKKFDRSFHLIALAITDEGYSNLVRLSSWAWIHGFYRKPRINYDVLNRYKEGIVFTTACVAGAVGSAFRNGGDEAGFQELEDLISIIGKDNLYLEMIMLDFEPQKPYDKFMIRCHEKYGLPLTISQDCHYAIKEHSHLQRCALMSQTGKTIGDINQLIAAGGEDIFELQDSNLWCKSEDELNQKWESDYQDVIDYELFKQAKSNSVLIAERCKGVKIDRESKLPRSPDADSVLWQQTQLGFIARNCPDTKQYRDRIQEEYDLISNKGFSNYFLIEKEFLDVAREHGPTILGFGDGSECVGPGRGSICGSLLAYCLRLHDVDPIVHDLRFSRFLSPARGGKQMRVRHTIKPVAKEKV